MREVRSVRSYSRCEACTNQDRLKVGGVIAHDIIVLKWKSTEMYSELAWLWGLWGLTEVALRVLSNCQVFFIKHFTSKPKISRDINVDTDLISPRITILPMLYRRWDICLTCSGQLLVTCNPLSIQTVQINNELFPMSHYKV